MLHPAPTDRIDPGLTRGTLEATHEQTATRPAYLELGLYNSDYRLHLIPLNEITAKVGKRIVGVIRAEAKRVDIVRSGGKYVEPVMGRPRRVQGRVGEIDNARNTITVDANAVVVCRLTDHRQRASDFEPGQFVSFDVLSGATFEQSTS